MEVTPTEILESPNHIENNQQDGEETIKKGNNQGRKFTEGRRHGQDVRRLVKMVCSAYLNPGEWTLLTR